MANDNSEMIERAENAKELLNRTYCRHCYHSALMLIEDTDQEPVVDCGDCPLASALIDLEIYLEEQQLQ